MVLAEREAKASTDDAQLADLEDALEAAQNKISGLKDQLKDEREQHQECQRKVSTMKELLGNVVADSPRRAEAHKLQQMAEDQASGITPEKDLPPEKKRRLLDGSLRG